MEESRERDPLSFLDCNITMNPNITSPKSTGSKTVIH